MNLTLTNLRESERITLTLRMLYERYGYRAFSMNRLEEYAFYAENINFLGGAPIAAFADLDGRLMALKPDVTLSIVKSAAMGEGLEKLYYAETVFRAAKESRTFREIRQMGLECIGEVLPYTVAEVVGLAAKTLAAVDEAYSLDLSHLGYVNALLDEMSIPYPARSAMVSCIKQKNPHDLRALAQSAGVAEADIARLTQLTTLQGSLSQTLAQIRALCGSEAMAAAARELCGLCALLPQAKLRLDFSIMPDFEYYNGIAFSGFVRRAPAAVLAGGQYDKLLCRMGKRGRAVGFALYFDELERYYEQASPPQTDVFIHIDAKTDPARIMQTVEDCAQRGERVLADVIRPADADAMQIIDLRGDA